MKSYAVETYDDVRTGIRKRFPCNFWKDDENKKLSDAAEITRYFIEEVLQWDDEKVKTDICCKVFFQNKLKGMLCVLFNDSVFAALNNAYPGKFKEWELACTPRNFWNYETARLATIWLFKERLKMSDDEIRQNVSRKIFVENGFAKMLHDLFNNNATAAISNAFPNLL